jgi:hypothetical protein
MTLRLPNRVRRIISSFASVFGGDIIYGIHDESKYDVVILGAGHNGLVWVNGVVSTFDISKHLDRRTFAVFGGADGGAFLAEHGDTEVPDFMVDLAKSGFGKFVRRGKFLFELRHAFQCVIL